MKRLALTGALLLFPTLSVADLAKGVEAYDKGDFSLAHKEFLETAREGDAVAQYRLASLFYDGEGVGQSYEMAVTWYQRSAGQGFAAAQKDLGYAYAMGEGVAEDDAEAIKWYRLAGEQGDIDAQASLGALLADGHMDEAIQWFLRAANQGDPLAQYNLAGLYFLGEGIEKDLIEAHKWVNLASMSPEAEERGPNNPLATMRDMIKERMNEAQLKEAWKRAREWRKSAN